MTTHKVDGLATEHAAGVAWGEKCADGDTLDLSECKAVTWRFIEGVDETTKGVHIHILLEDTTVIQADDFDESSRMLSVFGITVKSPVPLQIEWKEHRGIYTFDDMFDEQIAATVAENATVEEDKQVKGNE